MTVQEEVLGGMLLVSGVECWATGYLGMRGWMDHDAG